VCVTVWDSATEAVHLAYRNLCDNCAKKKNLCPGCSKDPALAEIADGEGAPEVGGCTKSLF
jgi:hypothetical protein